MGVRKCCVCEGSIVNGRCRDCGMPYRRDEELYHLNENRRDHYKHASKEAREKLEKLEGAMDQIRKKYGGGAIAFGAAQNEKEEDPLP